MLVVVELECREVRIVCFDKRAGEISFGNLSEWFKTLWVEAASAGVKTYASVLFQEMKEEKAWKTTKQMIVVPEDDSELLPLRRMFALLYEMVSCCRPAISVV